MITFTVTLTLRSPLHIGSGTQQGTLANRGMLKDRDGWPYVPASAFKGQLRHAVEQVAAALPLPGAPVCTTHQEMCRHLPLCPVCQIFGAPWHAGAARFHALHLSGPPTIMDVKNTTQGKRPPRTTPRTGVTLNRSRGVAEDKRLFSTELLWPGMPLAFSGSITGPLTYPQAGLLLAGLQHLAALGGSKSAGLGWLTAQVRVQENDRLLDSAALLGEIVP